MANFRMADRLKGLASKPLLMLVVACGFAVNCYLLEQWHSLELQRASLQALGQSRGELHRGLVQMAIDGRDQGLARHSLRAFRESCWTFDLNGSVFESKILPLLEPKPALTLQTLRQELREAQQVDLEAGRLYDDRRNRFVAREAELGGLFFWAMFFESGLLACACWFLLGQMREGRRLTSTLLEKEAQLRAVVDNLPESYLYQYEHEPGEPPRFLYASSGLERVHGVSVAEALREASSLLSQLTPHHAEIFQQLEAASASNMSDFDMEMEFRRPGGPLRLLRVRSRPRLLPNGRILWDGYASDVTDRRRAETRFQTLFENAYEGIYQSTPDGRLLDVNPSMARTFGFSSREEMLAAWPDAKNLYARPAEREQLVRLLCEAGTAKNFEFQGRRQDGTPIWISTNVHAVYNASGSVEYYEGIGLDISERKQSLERIRQLNRVHALRSDINQTILHGASAQAIFEAACRLSVEQGQFACACIGMLEPQPEVRSRAGRPLPSGLFESDPVLPKESIRGEVFVCNNFNGCGENFCWQADALRLGYRSVAVLPLKLRERVIGFFTLFSTENDFFDANEIQLLEGLAADISFALGLDAKEQQRLKTEEELRLSQEHVRQAQKMEGIGQLAGGVAHDFNNILAVILIQTEMLLAGQSLPEELAEGLREIQSSATRAANLTRQLLLFSRRQVMVMADLELNELVTQPVKMLRRIIGEDIALELKLCPRPLYVRADAGMLDQVLLNLAVNSRDAMPHGGRLSISISEEFLGTERVSHQEDLPEGRYCVLSVSDTGCGMSPDVIEHIFEPFFTTKELGRGTGLGLATTFGIIRQHRGMSLDKEPLFISTSPPVPLPARSPATRLTSQLPRPPARKPSCWWRTMPECAA